MVQHGGAYHADPSFDGTTTGYDDDDRKYKPISSIDPLYGLTSKTYTLNPFKFVSKFRVSSPKEKYNSINLFHGFVD